MRFIVDMISVFVTSAFLYITIAFIVMPGYTRVPSIILCAACCIEFGRATADFARHFRK